MTDFLIRTFVKNKEHPRDPAVRTAYGKLSGTVGIVCNLLLCAVKAAAGFLSGSVAVTADALNNVSDAASGIITLAGFRLSARPADDRHPYGHARMEYISGLGVSVLILVIGVELALSSIRKILHPSPVEFTAVTAMVLTGSVLLKMWMAVFNRKIGMTIASSAVEAAAVDCRSDAAATLAILIAGIVQATAGIGIDGWMGLAVAVLIFRSGIETMKETLSTLLGEAPDEELIRHIRQKILSYDGILGTHDLLVHDYGPGRRFASVHVEMDAAADVLKSHDIIDRIERSFLEEEHINLVIHYDPVSNGTDEASALRRGTGKIVAAIAPGLSIHDFRVEESDNETLLYFDVASTGECWYTDDELRARIQQIVDAKTAAGRKYRTVITVDHSFAPVMQEQKK